MIALANGTCIVLGESWCVTTLPNGREIHAHPNADSLRMARELGYGDDVARLTRDHDPLHSLLAGLLGMHASPSLMIAAGCSDDHDLAALDEAATLAVQRYARAAGWLGIRGDGPSTRANTPPAAVRLAAAPYRRR